ncbi:MAG: MogA/MoaB family molybdenum cofactor biosynthesis protein [Planctomycetota bacterium]
MPHHEKATFVPVNFAIVVTSDRRTPKTDLTGRSITKLLTAAGHKCASSDIVPNKTNLIRRVVKKLVSDKNIRLIITSGGTGCGQKDITIESIRPFLTRQLEGFGELFRALSYKEIGSRSFMSRALLGFTGGNKIIVCLPGSPNAVRLAMSKLVLPELNHIIWELSRT